MVVALVAVVAVVLGSASDVVVVIAAVVVVGEDVVGGAVEVARTAVVVVTDGGAGVVEDSPVDPVQAATSRIVRTCCPTLRQPVIIRPRHRLDVHGFVLSPDVCAGSVLVENTAVGSSGIAARIGARMKIYVGNLPFSTTNRDLETMFERFGAVESAQVVTDRDTGRSRGFGFVEMADGDARRAIEELADTDVDGRKLTVNEAKPRPQGGGDRRNDRNRSGGWSR